MFFKYTGPSSIQDLRSRIPSRRDIVSPTSKTTNLDDKYYAYDCFNYSINRSFSLALFSVNKLGEKIVMLLTGIDIYVEIIPESMSRFQDFIDNCDTLLSRQDQVMLKPFLGYQEHASDAYRIYFSSLESRDTFLNLLKKYQIQGTIGCNMPKNNFRYFISRHYGVNLLGWNQVSQLEEIRDSKFKGVSHVYQVSIQNIQGIDLHINPPLLLMGWDLETGTNNPYGGVPKPSDPESYIDYCSMIFNWYTHDEPCKCICLTTRVGSDSNTFTIRCQTEYELLIAFGVVIEAMNPDWMLDFNGFKYDWKFIFHKSCNRFIHYEPLYPILSRKDSGYNAIDIVTLQDFIKYCFVNYLVISTGSPYITKAGKRSRSIQLTQNKASRVGCYFMYYPGKVCMDLRVACIRLDNSDDVYESSSLNYFLRKNGLSDKIDMAYHRMDQIRWLQDMAKPGLDTSIEELLSRHISQKVSKLPDTGRIKKSRINTMDLEEKLQLLRDSDKVIEYCNYDALSCTLLCNRLTLITNFQDIASLTMVDVDSVLYNGIGSRVVNVVAKDCNELGYIMDETFRSNINNYKYDGAFIVPPKIGVYKQHPIGVLDIASEYPSVCMCYNISPEMCVMDEDYISGLSRKLEYVDYKIGPKGKDREKRTIAFIQYDHKTYEGMGILPKILLILKQRRSAMKKEIADIKSGKIKDRDPDYLKWLAGYLNIKQNNIKILMNSFYGVCGCESNPIYLVHVAGAIASKARTATKYMKSVAEEYGYEIVYGDTDSIFILISSDKTQSSGQNLEAIAKTLKNANTKMYELQDIINDRYKEMTGVPFLSIEFEKILFPFALFGMKNYIGAYFDPGKDPDLALLTCRKDEFSDLAFKEGKLFIKGGLTNKNTIKISRDIMMDIIYGIIHIHGSADLKKLAEDIVIHKFLNTRFLNIQNREELEPFLIRARYNKKSVITNHIRAFIEYMREINKQQPDINLDIPLDSERFIYVVSDILANNTYKSYIMLDNFFNMKYRKHIGSEQINISQEHYLKHTCSVVSKVVHTLPKYLDKRLTEEKIIQDRDTYKKIYKDSREKTCKLLFQKYSNKLGMVKKCSITRAHNLQLNSFTLRVQPRFSKLAKQILDWSIKKTPVEFMSRIRCYLTKYIPWIIVMKIRYPRVWKDTIQAVQNKYLVSMQDILYNIQNQARDFISCPLNFQLDIPQNLVMQLVVLVVKCRILQCYLDTLLPVESRKEEPRVENQITDKESYELYRLVNSKE